MKGGGKAVRPWTQLPQRLAAVKVVPQLTADRKVCVAHLVGLQSQRGAQNYNVAPSNDWPIFPPTRS